MEQQEAKRARKQGEDEMQVDEPSSRSLAHFTVQELMKAYYGKLFPHQHMYRWLAYGNDRKQPQAAIKACSDGKHPQADAGFFQKREFCFTLDGDIFVRYQAFKDGAEMRDAIKARCPSKIDIGPVYSCNPKDRLKFGTGFFPVERELVFDIDLTDYDNVRTCGKEGHICNKCWPLMAVAVQIIDRGLREDFGFKHILWVYSGRRGIHCWVCDPSARKLTDEQRSAVASYFAVYKGYENDKAKLMLGANGTILHPAVQQAAEVLRQHWEETILPQQQLMENEDMRATMLKHIPDEALCKTIRQQWEGKPPKGTNHLDVNVQRWRILEQAVQGQVQSQGNKASYQLKRCITEIMMAFSYPRLDMEVSKKMNHLLKAPFCVHPKTGKVCVPIDPDRAFEFDPETVPTVHQLLEQLDEHQREAQGDTAAAGDQWEHTALADSVQLFQETFLGPCLAAGRAELASKARAVATAPDFSF